MYSMNTQGYQQAKAYIATQGPMEHTTGEFWRMVVENGCSCIVMLCTLKEGEEVFSCSSYSFMLNFVPLIFPSASKPSLLAQVSGRHRNIR